MNNIKKLIQVSIVGIVFFSVIIYIGIFYMYENIKEDRAINKSSQKSARVIDTNYDMINEIKNILVVGIDDRGGDKITRADAIMIMSIDKNRDKLKFTSIMRDAYVKIPNHDYDKINHSYAFGGVELLRKTLENNYNIPIDNYVVIDFGGFKNIIDSIGGISIDVKEKEIKELNRCIYLEIDEDNELSTDEKKEVKEKIKLIESPGEQKLNGYQALAYSRIRKVGKGCYDRTQRQRYVVNTLIEELKDISLLKYPFIAKDFFQYIDADLKINDIVNVAYTVSKIPLDNMEQLYIPTDKLSYGTMYRNKGWVLLNDINKNSKVLNNFIVHNEKYCENEYERFNVKKSRYWPLKLKKKKTTDIIKQEDNSTFIDIRKEIEEIFEMN
ncbi:LCP family protein [Oceanirhabdus sp. W0125-5]|uniref:LCP family protein n=1 Tax=Oceanirhabdus sp. W0125-5 TaxID=2999116 RepID=UPI0022F2C897|nr:LCP family protein [Oceanirhabdus sp. W0125-5]WBW97541.1 LCP family protein [Oceanirhabdus sp. W0125-5]